MAARHLQNPGTASDNSIGFLNNLRRIYVKKYDLSRLRSFIFIVGNICRKRLKQKQQQQSIADTDAESKSFAFDDADDDTRADGKSFGKSERQPERSADHAAGCNGDTDARRPDGSD